MKRSMVILLTMALTAGAAVSGAARVARAEDVTLPTAAEIQALVEAGQYRDALKPLYRVLALKGSAASGYDRYELLMWRGECQLQIKDQHGALLTWEEARQQAFADNQPERAAAPTAMAYLVQHSIAYQYKPKAPPGAKGISILDKTQRPAACAALLADELPAAQLKVKAVNGAKSLAQVLVAARVAGAMLALETAAKPDAKHYDSAALAEQVTTNADRLMSTAIEDLTKTADTIKAAADQVVTEPVMHYDPASKRSWMEQVTRRRGPSGQETDTLNAIGTTCDKLKGSAVEMAVALATDFAAYKTISDKADGLKQKASAILNENYLVVPP